MKTNNEPVDPIELHMNEHAKAKYRVKIFTDIEIISVAFNNIDKGLVEIKEQLERIN